MIELSGAHEPLTPTEPLRVRSGSSVVCRVDCPRMLSRHLSAKPRGTVASVRDASARSHSLRAVLDGSSHPYPGSREYSFQLRFEAGEVPHGAAGRHVGIALNFCKILAFGTTRANLSLNREAAGVVSSMMLEITWLKKNPLNSMAR